MTKKTMEPPAGREKERLPVYWWAVLIASVLFTSIIRIRLLGIPLERDEGEFAYMGQLLLKGIPPYLHAYSMKLPGIYGAYAFIMLLFGQTPQGIHLGLLLVNLVSTLMLFLLTRRLFGLLAAAAAAAAFSILSVNPSVLGLAGHATQFVVLFALAGMLLLLKYCDDETPVNLALTAIFLGLAFTMKQPGLVFAVFGALYLAGLELASRPISRKRLLWRLAVYAMFVSLPFVLISMYMRASGAWDKYWFWTFRYAREYAAEVPLSDAISTFFRQFGRVAVPTLSIWCLAAVGIVRLFVDRNLRRRWPMVIGLLVLAFIGVCPGFYFRVHYFVLVLPVIAMLSGIAVSWGTGLAAGTRFNKLATAVSFLLLIASLGLPLVVQREYFFKMTPREACRASYSANPFPESIEIANYIKKHTKEGDSIAVIGSEPQIYFYSHRQSATGYIYTYGMMEDQPFARQMQGEMIREIESAKPKYLVLVAVPTSWLIHPGSDRTIFDWAGKYYQSRYRRVGVMEILSSSWTQSVWGDEALDYAPSGPAVQIYRRKDI